MRKIIAALQISLDGFIEGPNKELDWAMADDEETWIDINETLNSVDTIILGRMMYPEYEQYWLALLANPTGTKNENAYAHRADKIPHIILSKTLNKVADQTRKELTNVVKDLEKSIARQDVLEEKLNHAKDMIEKKIREILSH
jgi:dihydrofolate reductase